MMAFRAVPSGITRKLVSDNHAFSAGYSGALMVLSTQAHIYLAQPCAYQISKFSELSLRQEVKQKVYYAQEAKKAEAISKHCQNF